MREIKFRGKRVKDGKWVYGGYYFDDCYGNKQGEKHYIMVWNSTGLSFYENVQVIPETVGQYTGLKDREGKPIYENDIVKDDNGFLAIVFWDSKNASYSLDFLNGDVDWLSEYYKFNVIIGNVYENPELL